MDALIADYALKAVAVGGLLLVVLAVICLKVKEMAPTLSKILYGLIVVVTVLTTAFLAGSTIYLNSTSSSGGPVHWHGDFEIWKCGSEITLKDPSGWSNKMGTETLHHHGDKRIHQEGVVYEKGDNSLGKFFEVIGGEITGDSLTADDNSGKFTLKTGDVCSGQEAQFQVFVYRVDGQNNYTQEKISDPAHFVFAPHSQVPPGDCIIMELDIPKQKTDKLCRSYQVAKQIGKLGEEVP